MPSLVTSASVALSALALMLVSYLNEWLFGFLPLANGFTWLFLPCGVSLLIVVLCGGWGALGIVLGSLMATQDFSSDFSMINTGACILSGLAPWAGSNFAIHAMKLRTSLSNLTPTALLKIGFVCAAATAISLELWLLSFGYSGPFFESLSTRMVGNILGTLAVLYVIKAFVVISGRLRSSKINSNAIAK